MTRDFPQLINDARSWLHQTKGHPSLRTEFGMAGWVRRRRAAILPLGQNIEIVQVSRTYALYGRITIAAAHNEQLSVNLGYGDGGLLVGSSALTPPDVYVALDELAGVQKDLVFEMFAPVIGALREHMAK